MVFQATKGKKFNARPERTINNPWDQYVPFEVIEVEKPKAKATKENEKKSESQTGNKAKQDNSGVKNKKSSNVLSKVLGRAALLEAGWYIVNEIGYFHDKEPILENIPSAMLGALGYTLGRYLSKEQSVLMAVTLGVMGLAGGRALKAEFQENTHKIMTNDHKNSVLEKPPVDLLKQTMAEAVLATKNAEAWPGFENNSKPAVL